MAKLRPLPRRTFLRGAAGTAIALPALEAMAPAAQTDKPPCRMVAICVRLGKNMMEWTPKATGQGYALPPTLKPLADFQNDFSVLSGLCHPRVWGGHRAETTCFLTGTDVFGAAGSGFQNTQSVDQVAAERVGHLTRFRSLELATVGSTAKKPFLAWNAQGLPLPVEWKPSAVFSRLFVEDSASTKKQLAAVLKKKRSILDLAMEDLQRLEGQIGQNDKRILDQYTNSVREVERRLEREHEWLEKPKPDVPLKRPRQDPSGQGPDRGVHMHVMFDLLTLAFQTDSTRIATYALNESTRPYTEAGVRSGHHGLTHIGGPKGAPDANVKLAKIDKYHVENLKYFLKKLKSTPDVGGTTLLDNVAILYGSGLGNAATHSNKDLPLLLAGHGCGHLKHGFHHHYEQGTPLSNLFVTLLQLLKVPADSFADSTGPLSKIT